MYSREQKLDMKNNMIIITYYLRLKTENFRRYKLSLI